MTAQAAMKLYEHTEAIQLVEDWIYEHDDEIRAAEGVLPPALAQLLEQAQMGFKEKAESVALMVRGFLASEVALDAEIARLTARKKHFEKAAAGLKEYLRRQLEAAGEKKITTARTTMWRQLSGPAVKCDLAPEDLKAIALDREGCPYVNAKEIPAETVYSVDRDSVLAWQREHEAVAAGTLDPLEREWPDPPAGIHVNRTEFLRIT